MNQVQSNKTIEIMQENLDKFIEQQNFNMMILYIAYFLCVIVVLLIGYYSLKPEIDLKIIKFKRWIKKL